jgi:hypothetical protein
MVPGCSGSACLEVGKYTPSTYPAGLSPADPAPARPSNRVETLHHSPSWSTIASTASVMCTDSPWAFCLNPQMRVELHYPA